MTDPGALIRPDPREIVLDPHGPWPLCTDCKASHGASWGAVVDDATSLCLQHLDASTRKNYLDANNHENGRIDMRGCTFPDATIISDLADVGHVKPLILGDGACFVSTYLDSTTFHNMVSFNAARFLDSAQFNFVIFRGFADFQNAVFGDSAWFTTADFEVAGKFTNVRFSGSVKFGGAQFREFSFFDRTQFGAGSPSMSARSASRLPPNSEPSSAMTTRAPARAAANAAASPAGPPPATRTSQCA